MQQAAALETHEAHSKQVNMGAEEARDPQPRTLALPAVTCTRKPYPSLFSTPAQQVRKRSRERGGYLRVWIFLLLLFWGEGDLFSVFLMQEKLNIPVKLIQQGIH